MLHLFFGVLIALSFFFLLIHFIYTLIAIFKGAVYLPTPKKRVRQIVSLAKPKKTDVVIDLGSGDGRILAAFRKAGVKECIGIEINPLLYLFSKIRFFITGQKNVKTYFKDIWKTDLSNVDILATFFVPVFMEKLEKKILNEMKKGSRVVSYRFKFPNLELVDSLDNVYLYKL